MDESDTTPPDNRRPRREPPRSSGSGCLFWALGIALAGSLFLNCVMTATVGTLTNSKKDDQLPEKVLYSTDPGGERVAVVEINGVLMEGMIDRALKQIEQATKDDTIKAVVVQVNSPGGTITASEELHRRLIWLRDGKSVRYPESTAKPLVVSMSSLAASGGYYVAMPASKIYAEKTTLTGSIGVYASLPNVSELGDKLGFHMELIKAGGIKGSGSPFHELTPQERQPWQEMVDHAYLQFLEVVHAGRPKLSIAALRDEPLFTADVILRDEKGQIRTDWWGRSKTTSYQRFRADGGTFTADEAKKYGLIDEIGTLEDAAQAAATLAGLAGFQVITYEKHPSIFDGLLGVKSERPALGGESLSRALLPRVWMLAPGSDLAAISAAMR